MKKKILIPAFIFLAMVMNAQVKEGAFLVNGKQKKLFSNSGQSDNLAWYTISEKSKDTVIQKTFISSKSRFNMVMDSLKKEGFDPKLKKEKVADAILTIKLTTHRFYKTDTLKKDGGKFTVDSIFVLKAMINISSEKEKLNKTRVYDQKYTTLNQAKLEGKIKKFKDFSLVKFTDAGILELDILFEKLLMLNPKSNYNSFEPAEREFF